jgi:hypothetical protein
MTGLINWMRTQNVGGKSKFWEYADAVPHPSATALMPESIVERNEFRAGRMV